MGEKKGKNRFCILFILFVLLIIVILIIEYPRPKGIATGAFLDISLEQNVVEKDGTIRVTSIVPHEFSCIGNITFGNGSNIPLDLYMSYEGDESFFTEQEKTLKIDEDLYLFFSSKEDNPVSSDSFILRDIKHPYKFGPILSLLPRESVSIYVHLYMNEEIQGKITPRFNFIAEFISAPPYETVEFNVNYFELKQDIAEIHISLKIVRKKVLFPSETYPIAIEFPDYNLLEREFTCEGNICEYDDIIPVEGKKWLYPFDTYRSLSVFVNPIHLELERKVYGHQFIRCSIKGDRLSLLVVRIAEIPLFLIIIASICFNCYLVLSKSRVKTPNKIIYPLFLLFISISIYGAPFFLNLGMILLISVMIIYLYLLQKKGLEFL